MIYPRCFIAGKTFLKISKQRYDFSFLGINMK